MFKRNVSVAGDLSDYLGYAIPLWICYFLSDAYLLSTTGPLHPPLQTILQWAYRLVLYPFILAGINGAIFERQRNRTGENPDGFLTNARRNFWRVAGANLAFTAVLAIAAITLGLALGSERGQAILRYGSIAALPFNLFWFAAIVAEGGLFKSLIRAVKILLSNPLAIAIGIGWGLAGFADDSIGPVLNDPRFLALRLAETALLAVLRVLATVYFLALYWQIRGEAINVEQADVKPETAAAASHEGLIKASIGFAFMAFLPLVHLVALILGIMAIKRNKRFVLRSAIAVCVGAFFTIFYAFLIAGFLITGSSPSREPRYAFLKETTPALAPQVALLEKGSWEPARGALQAINSSSAAQPWTTKCALAIAQWHAHDLDGALDTFYAAAQARPERSEFYFYYGLALLDNDKESMAADQFQLAAAHGPKLAVAERYGSLIDAAYHPSPLVSAMLFLPILLLLFTFHEFGHAFAAWKLGDDTAKNLGRLTLNPIRHLDIFGSILLPGILLWNQSTLIFGWAKPVPVNPENFKDPVKDQMRVSFAGPAVNILISMACFIVLGSVLLLVRLFWPDTLTWHIADTFSPIAIVGPPFAHGLTIIIAFLKQLMYTSLILGFFNLLPIPPLDGSWILSGILPQRARSVFEQGRRFSFVIFLILVATPVVRTYLSIPLDLAWGGFQLFAVALGLG